MSKDGGEVEVEVKPEPQPKPKPKPQPKGGTVSVLTGSWEPPSSVLLASLAACRTASASLRFCFSFHGVGSDNDDDDDDGSASPDMVMVVVVVMVVVMIVMISSLLPAPFLHCCLLLFNRLFWVPTRDSRSIGDLFFRSLTHRTCESHPSTRTFIENAQCDGTERTAERAMYAV